MIKTVYILCQKVLNDINSKIALKLIFDQAENMIFKINWIDTLVEILIFLKDGLKKQNSAAIAVKCMVTCLKSVWCYSSREEHPDTTFNDTKVEEPLEMDFLNNIVTDGTNFNVK